MERVEKNGALRLQEGLAFGTHSGFEPDDDGEVVNATVFMQVIRIVLDERMPTDALDEIECEDGQFDRVPAGTTEEELAACAASSPSPSACSVDTCMANGGFLDEDRDGRPDARRLFDYNDDPATTEYAVALLCDEVSVPLDPYFSGYFAYGSQIYDPSVGARSLGPSIVLKPVADIGLRTGSTCSLAFRPEVLDEDGNRICAPANGLSSEGCSEGDVSRISFGSVPLSKLASSPSDGAVGVSLAPVIFLAFNANIDSDTLGSIRLTTGGTPVEISPQAQDGDSSAVVVNLNSALLPATEYQLSIGTGLTDLLGGHLQAEVTINWTTEG